MTDLDTLLDTIVADAMLDKGAPPAVVQSRGGLARPKKQSDDANRHSTRWTDEEDQFLQDNLGRIPLEEIASELGRTILAVKIRYTRKGYPTPSNLPGWISLTQASRLLGVTNHAVPGWFRNGIFPGRYAFTRNQNIVIVKVTDLRFWATRPRHWPYFNVSDMPPGHLRRLVEKAQKRWGDEWLTTVQVAEMHNLNHRDILNAIYKGRLAAIQCPHIGGRDTATWAYWFIKKSDALKYHHLTRSQARTKAWFTPRAEAYLRQLVIQGKTSADAARLMRQSQKYLANRMIKIRKEIK